MIDQWTRTDPRIRRAVLSCYSTACGGQEVTHKLVLAELLRHTDLVARLGLWNSESRPSVVVEPNRGIFDLALQDRSGPVVFIELKFAPQSR